MIEFPESPMLGEAHGLAAREHAGQRRKANGDAYIAHVSGVARTLADGGFDEEVVAAALLHDLVEHTDIRSEEVSARFGQRVGTMVDAMTDRGEITPWRARKDEHRERIRGAGRDACAIYAADKLAGIRETRDGYAELGEAIESRLGTPLDERAGVWGDDLAMLRGIEPEIPHVEMIAVELDRLQEDRAAAPAHS